MKISVDFYNYNKVLLVETLEELGINFEDLTVEQLGKMLSFAIGYCDFSNKTVVKELLEEIGK